MARFIAQKTLRDFLQETEDAISSGRVDAALANCQTILASFPELLEAQRLLGEVYLAQGRLEEALHAFDWVLTNDPENVLAYCNRAAVSERMSDIDTSLDCYQQAYELSRGNGQIRQEFTKLSAKVGQQGFVFSRAGLARLYMRGNLLSQAIQEWEAVLTITPDRLDARTGLLEAYWREGTLHQTEELATQILQDVSSCVKALLLLAHVTASKDMARAQALLRQVEALDPDLVMAQELFTDMFARLPDDPFLKLLRKEPCVLNAASTSESAFQPPIAPSSAVSLQGGQAISEINASDPVRKSPPWENSQNWSKDASFLSPFLEGDLQQNNSTPWAIDHTNSPKTDNGVVNGDWRQAIASSLEPSDPAVQLSSDITPMGSWTMQEVSSAPTPSQESQPEPWEMLQNALHSAPSVPSQESQPEPWEMLQNALHNMPSSASGPDQNGYQQWEDQSAVSDLNNGGENLQSQNLDTFAEPAPSSSDSWINSVDEHADEGINGILAAQEKNPPSWLSMLTQADHKQMTSSISPLENALPSPALPEEEISSSSFQESIVQQSMTSLPPSPWAQELEAASPLDVDDEEESSFGPAWLRSLGAATLVEEEVSHLEPVSSISPLSTEVEKQEQPVAYTSKNALEEASLGELSAAYDPWWPSASGSEKQPVVEPNSQVELVAFKSDKTVSSMSQPEVVSSSAEKVEQDLVMTLEELEQQLLAKGFVAMEPKSLSTIAQAEEAKSANTVTPLSAQQTSQPIQEVTQKQASSSALAELGMMFHEPDSEVKPVISSTLSSVDAADFPAEPLWLQELRSSSKLESGTSTAEATFSTPIVSRPASSTKVSQELPNTPPVPEAAMSELKFEPTLVSASSSAVSEQAGGSKGQSVGANPFLDSELETTMKRPAVRLQSMVHSRVSRDHAGSTGKVRTRERGNSSVARTVESENLNYRECLLKGYQHQLVGDYDEAMQDYRLVIRGAPELLGEVISNLRALLKLAPKYSIGYRVLGDAYMRQGEYLQAMEAYNSALTMAKKARS